MALRPTNHQYDGTLRLRGQPNHTHTPSTKEKLQFQTFATASYLLRQHKSIATLRTHANRMNAPSAATERSMHAPKRGLLEHAGHHPSHLRSCSSAEPPRAKQGAPTTISVFSLIVIFGQHVRKRGERRRALEACGVKKRKQKLTSKCARRHGSSRAPAQVVEVSIDALRCTTRN